MAVRVASRPIRIDATPTRAPAVTSTGWCMPRYIRERATTRGMATATGHRTRSRGHRDAITIIRPQ